MEAYCLKCREKREITNPEQGYLEKRSASHQRRLPDLRN